MAYLRYSSKCDWYVFDSSKEVTAKEQCTLAVWHVDYRKQARDYTYDEILQMLKNDDFSQILGYDQKYHDILKKAFVEFINDVKADFSKENTKK
jgi:hypothetical protein